MMKEEEMIRKIEGQKNPFRVPEGYFDNFNERLAKRLPPMQEQKTVRLTPRLWRYAAAVLFIVGAGIVLYTSRSDQQSFAYSEEVSQEEYVNEALDYILVDNMEIAEYLTEAD